MSNAAEHVWCIIFFFLFLFLTSSLPKSHGPHATHARTPDLTHLPRFPPPNSDLRPRRRQGGGSKSKRSKYAVPTAWKGSR